MTFVILLLALLLVAWFTATATAVRSVSWIWLRGWAEQRLGASAPAGRLLARPHRLLTAASAGVAATVVLAGAWLGARHAVKGWELAGELLLLFLIFLLLGQLVPRAVARRWAAQLVPIFVPPLRGFATVVAPALAGGQRLASALVSAPVDDVDRDGIEELLREGELEGIGDREEIEIITGIVEFGEKVVSDVMTPRTEVFALDESLDATKMARAIAQSGYSRVPVYRGSLDEIVGMVHAFDVLKARGERVPPLRPVVQTPATRRCSELLLEMLRAQRHLAVVIDEYGGTAGIVTLEDLLEELVGEINDEHDEPAAIEGLGAPPALILDARTELADVERRFGVELPEVLQDRAQTLGGILVKELGRIPSPGERIRVASLEVTVLETEPTRVLRVLVQPADSNPIIDIGERR